MARRIGLECCACGQIFSGEISFKKHRTGYYGACVRDSNGIIRYKHERRCLTVDSMLAKGLTKNERGLWTTNVVDDTEEEQEKEGMKV